MADTLGVIICFLIGYFTSIRDYVMTAQNLPSLTLWLIKSILSRPFGCASHFLHALKTAVKTLPSFSNQFKQYYLGDFPKECVNLLTDSVCSRSVYKAKGYIVKQNTVFSSDFFFEWHLKNAPLLVLPDLFRNEKTEGEKGRVTEGNRVPTLFHFLACSVCWLRADWKVIQPADKPRHSAYTLISTFLAGWRALHVLCVCCLKVLSWNSTYKMCLAISNEFFFPFFLSCNLKLYY